MKPPQPTPTEALSAVPASQDALSLGETHLQPSGLSEILSSGTLDSLPGASSNVGSQAGRYQLLERHAQGGLGEIFRAEDQELHRQVALKRLKPERGAALHQARFLQEAELTAELEHPGVVPVYGLVHDSADHPCYAMRFVEGPTLADAAQRFHAALKEAADPAQRFRGVEFRQLLQRFIAVCNTVAFAHSRGILHRDLKPANIMVGPFGETLLLDWGLAKRLGTAGLPDEGSEVRLHSLPPTLATSESSVPQLTQAGQILGTPAYMSPEQVDGLTLTPAADVYGLGAILYELLTGQPPVPPGDLRDVLTKVREGRVTAPRTVQPAVPRGLEAIAQKALARNPFDRYASALDLARDVEGWLADEPLAALPDSRWVSLRRWARRHRTLVTALAASLVVALLGLGLTTLLLGRKNADLEEANQRERDAATRARSEAARAEQNAMLADQVVEKLLGYVSENTLLNQPNFEGLRRQLLEQALAVQQTLLAAQKNLPRLHETTARTHFRLGILLLKMDRLPEAEKQYAQGLDIIQQMLDQAPQQRTFRLLLAFGKQRMMHLHLVRGDYERVLAIGAEANALLAELRETDNDQDVDLQLAEVRTNEAAAWRAKGEIAKGRAASEEAMRLLERVYRQRPDSALGRRIAFSLHHLGSLAQQVGDLPTASRYFRRSATFHQQLNQEQEPTIFDREMYFGCLLDWQTLLTDGKELADALIISDQAVAAGKDLVRDQPLVLAHRLNLAKTLINRAQTLGKLERAAEGLADIQQAESLLEQLAQERPNLPTLNAVRAKAISCHADLLFDTGKKSASLAKYDQGIAFLEGLPAEAKVPREVRETLGAALCNSAIKLRDTGNLPEAFKRFAQAMKVHEALFQEFPQDAKVRHNLATTYVGRGFAHEDAGHHQQAGEDFLKALELQRPVVMFFHVHSLRNFLLAGDLRSGVKVFDLYPPPEEKNGAWFIDYAGIAAGLAALSQGDERKHWFERSWQLLRRAEELGAFKSPENVKIIDRVPALATLRAMPEWASFRSRLKSPPETPHTAPAQDNPPPSP